MDLNHEDNRQVKVREKTLSEGEIIANTNNEMNPIVCCVKSICSRAVSEANDETGNNRGIIRRIKRENKVMLAL